VPEYVDVITHAGRSETGMDKIISPIREALGGAVSLRLAIFIVSAISQTGNEIVNFFLKGTRVRPGRMILVMYIAAITGE